MLLFDGTVPGVDLRQQVAVVVHGYFLDRKMVQIFSRILCEPPSSPFWRTPVPRSSESFFCVACERAARMSLIACATGGFSCSSTAKVSRSRHSSSLSSTAKHG